MLIELSDQWSGLHVVDGRADFLATGEPPSEDLFLVDRLHLSPTGYEMWNSQVHAALDEVIAAGASPEMVVDEGTYRVDFGAAAGDGADESTVVVTFPSEGGLTAGEQWHLVGGAGRPGPRLVVADWNLTPAPDGDGVFVRPPPFAHFTLEGVEPGTMVTATAEPVDPATPSRTVAARADDFARVHLHLHDVGADAMEIASIEILLGGEDAGTGR